MRAGRISFGAVGTEMDVSSKIRHWCARAERSPQQVRRKLADWGASGQADRILDALLDEDYVNAVRFAEAFTHDHLEFRNWGPRQDSLGLDPGPPASTGMSLEIPCRLGVVKRWRPPRPGAAQGWRRLRRTPPGEGHRGLGPQGFSIDCAIRAAEAAEAD